MCLLAYAAIAHSVEQSIDQLYDQPFCKFVSKLCSAIKMEGRVLEGISANSRLYDHFKNQEFVYFFPLTITRHYIFSMGFSS